jgi:hypothetical protein
MPDFTHDEPRPRTPTGPSRTFKPSASMRPLNTSQPQQDTFFDDATPVDRSGRSNMGGDRLRDSHDLSFEGATIRDSVVDNMLLSLDQFSTGHTPGHGGSQYGEDDFFLRDDSYRPPGIRNRGHTYTSSRSSDYDLRPEDPSRQPANPARSRRSNSSNTIGLPMSRKASAREALGGRQPNSPYGQLAGHVRGAGKKSSKGSGSSSMDFGQAGILGNQRLGFGKRSASFDHSNMGDRSRMPPAKVESVLDRGRVAYQNYAEDYDAAPEPTIPAGPRRVQDPPQSPIAHPSQPALAPPPAPGMRRRGSLRSNTSYKTLRKNKSQVEPNMRAQAQEFVNASTLRDLPPVPSFQNPSAASPNVTPRTSLFSSPTPAAAPKDKDRPGFFRRVFGGSSSRSQPQLSNASSNSNNSQAEPSPASGKQRMPDIDSMYSQTRPRTTPGNGHHMASQIKAMPKGQQAEPPSQADMLPPSMPILAKKPSSFFRRRKKSMSENTKPPVMALDFTPPQPARPVIPAQSSPSVSSLRKVMNPYLSETAQGGERLNESRGVQPLQDTSNGARAQGFSPGYKPHRDATVRTVKASARADENTPLPSRGDQVKMTHLASPDSPIPKLKLKRGKAAVPIAQEDTFLADSSSANEDVGERSGSGVDERRPSMCPTSSSLNQSLSEVEGRSDHHADRSTALLFPVPPSKTTSAKTTLGSAAVSQSASEAEDEGFLVTQPLHSEQAAIRTSSAGSKRVWLDTTSADDITLPLEGARSALKSAEISPTTPYPTTSPNDVFHSATSLPIVQVESRESDTMLTTVETRSEHTESTDAERERALQIFNGEDSSALKAQAAALLGDVTLSSMRTRKAFMDLFDWTGFNILAAMRDMCSKIVLKAETQQVDRILMSLSERWCESNPNHGFKAVGESIPSVYLYLLTWSRRRSYRLLFYTTTEHRLASG